MEIINKCFNTQSPKSVQKLGLFELQPLLNDFKQLYFPYIEVLLQIDPEIKQIILSEEPIKAGEDIYFSLGNVSFNYKLKSDISNFDRIILCNSLMDMIIQNKLDSFYKEHMEIITVCAGDPSEFGGP